MFTLGHLAQWLSNGLTVLPTGRSMMSGHVTGCHNSQVVGGAAVWYVEPMDAAKPPITHRAAPITKPYPAQDVSRAEKQPGRD